MSNQFNERGNRPGWEDTSRSSRSRRGNSNYHPQQEWQENQYSRQYRQSPQDWQQDWQSPQGWQDSRQQQDQWRPFESQQQYGNYQRASSNYGSQPEYRNYNQRDEQGNSTSRNSIYSSDRGPEQDRGWNESRFNADTYQPESAYRHNEMGFGGHTQGADRDNNPQWQPHSGYGRTNEYTSTYGRNYDSTYNRNYNSGSGQQNWNNPSWQESLQNGGYKGYGPRNYTRSDERISEDINDRLHDDAYIDATDVQVNVKSGEVILEGTVESRQAKRQVEDLAEAVSGVKNVENRVRIKKNAGQGYNRSNDQNGNTDNSKDQSSSKNRLEKSSVS